jgi:hypothetical protein
MFMAAQVDIAVVGLPNAAVMDRPRVAPWHVSSLQTDEAAQYLFKEA